MLPAWSYQLQMMIYRGILWDLRKTSVYNSNENIKSEFIDNNVSENYVFEIFEWASVC